MFIGTALLRTRNPLAALLVALPLAVAGCSAPSAPEDSAPAAANFGHVHGISVDPRSSRILLATHTGLYDVSGKSAVKISDTAIDLMGFTGTAEPNVFYASGHPGPDSPLPNPVGLIRSDDAGKTWRTVSRAGRSDFHALTGSGDGLVAYDGQLHTSLDGTNWTTSAATFAPAVLAGSPVSAAVLATTQEGLQRSVDHGKSWGLVEGAPIMQFVAFAGSADKAPVVAAGVTPDGAVHVSLDAGLSWTAAGRVTDHVEAIAATEGADGKPCIWAATTGGVHVSTDGGETFHPAAL
ncbi:F510_1955 family glycosylhydrolase [Arthrobacter sp.]|jgi:hypothetical protein|uniref:F510_1955 family glycosylhydrolase n=1 Tax=Arthrobacter sp. TaxID=1667 RepID=UPI00258FDF8E|nr:exo-alpha-sialidase [Arthrobacter sp.]